MHSIHSYNHIQPSRDKLRPSPACKQHLQQLRQLDLVLGIGNRPSELLLLLRPSRL